jgi:PAS domain S-box-containing protein
LHGPRSRVDPRGFPERRGPGGPITPMKQGASAKDRLTRLGGAVRLAREATALRRVSGDLERSARRDDARNAAMLEAVRDGIFLVDNAQTITEFNPAAERMFGLKRAAAIGRAIDDLIEPSVVAGVPGTPLRVTLAGPELPGKRLEMTARRANGSLFPVELTLSRLSTQGDAQIAGVFRDISERKSHEAAGLERQRQSAFAQDVGVAFTVCCTLDAMLNLCAQLMVTHLDCALARVWTRTLDKDSLELLASAARDVSQDGPGVAPVDPLPLDEIVRERRTVATNTVIGDPRIDQAWASAHSIVSFVGYPLIVGERVVGVIALFGSQPFPETTVQSLSYVAHAIASAIERARVEAELRQADERVRFAHASAGIGIWELDIGSGRAAWSDTLFSMHGLAPASSAPTGDAYLAMVHPDDRTATMQTIASISTIGPVMVEYRILWADGSIHWLDVRSQPGCATDGRPACLIGVAFDITERKRLEEQLRQSQKMDAIGQLAGGVAHDFNNLLTAILGYSKLAADDLAPGDQRRLDVEEVIKTAHRAASLTKQLLAFSRTQVLHSTSLDLNELITSVSGMLRPLIGEQIALELALASDLALVRADASQIEQMVINLSVNARDAMATGGCVTLQTANVHLDGSPGESVPAIAPGWYVMLAVIDHGTGMDEHTKRHLFEPFFTTKDRGKGTGLGLATVYGIVKQSNGHIRVESELGRGSTFRVYLPRAGRAVSSALAAAAVPAPTGGSETVLLVEDEAGVRNLASRMLRDAGYSVLEAAHGQDAELIFAQHPDAIDLLVTDVIMPGTSGPDLYRRLVAEQPGLKVVFISGYATEAMARQVQLDRSQPYIQKPFTAAQLVSGVRRALDDERAASPKESA